MGHPTDRALIVAAGATCLPFLVCAGAASEDFLVRFFPDDAFYYLQPAFNFAHVGRSTFDGVHFTNGYHPLNFLLVSLLARWTTKMALLRVTFALDALMLAAACAILTQQFGRHLRASLRSAVLAGMMLPVFNIFIVLSMGLEAALVVLCTALLVAAWGQVEQRGLTTLASLGVSVALGALLLARLDLVFVVAPPIVLFIRHLVSPSALRLPPSALRPPPSALLIAIVPLICLGTYLAINLALTGHPAPISAYVKGPGLGLASWSPSTQNTWIGRCLAAAPFVASAAVLVVSWMAGTPAPRQARSLRGGPNAPLRSLAHRRGPTPNIIRWLNITNLIFGVYLAAATHLVFRWYFSFPLATLLATVAWAGARSAHARASAERTHRAVSAVGVAVAAATNLLAIVWIGSRPDSTSLHLKRIASLVDRYGGPHAVTGTTDAGVIGFFSQGRVINLDGLANDFVYLNEYLRRGRVADYLRQEGGDALSRARWASAQSCRGRRGPVHRSAHQPGSAPRAAGGG